MECTQAEAFEQYIRNLRVVRSISRPSFPEGKAPAAVLEEIQTNALRCNALMRQNEALLAQFVYDRDPASLTETDIQGLSAFAGRLFNYANSEDMGVAFKVHQLLLAAARSREDVPMIVRELYYTGITLHYMNVRDEGTGINLLGDAIQVYFTEAAEYMSRYEQLDRNTRQYLIRCVGNTRLGMSRGASWAHIPCLYREIGVSAKRLLFFCSYDIRCKRLCQAPAAASLQPGYLATSNSSSARRTCSAVGGTASGRG